MFRGEGTHTLETNHRVRATYAALAIFGQIFTFSRFTKKLSVILIQIRLQSPAKGWSFPIFRASDLKFLGKIAKNHQKSEN
jgi:hypothetical protein